MNQECWTPGRSFWKTGLGACGATFQPDCGLRDRKCNTCLEEGWPNPQLALTQILWGYGYIRAASCDPSMCVAVEPSPRDSSFPPTPWETLCQVQASDVWARDISSPGTFWIPKKWLEGNDKGNLWCPAARIQFHLCHPLEPQFLHLWSRNNYILSLAHLIRLMGGLVEVKCRTWGLDNDPELEKQNLTPWQGHILYTFSFLVLIYSPGWAWTHEDPVSASYMLRLKMYTSVSWVFRHAQPPPHPHMLI